MYLNRRDAKYSARPVLLDSTRGSGDVVAKPGGYAIESLTRVSRSPLVRQRPRGDADAASQWLVA